GVEARGDRNAPDRRIDGDRHVTWCAGHGARGPHHQRRVAARRRVHHLRRSWELERAEEERLAAGFVGDLDVTRVSGAALSRSVRPPRPVLLGVAADGKARRRDDGCERERGTEPGHDPSIVVRKAPGCSHAGRSCSTLPRMKKTSLTAFFLVLLAASMWA